MKEYLARCRVHKLAHKYKIDGVEFWAGDVAVRIGRVENMQGTYTGAVVEVEYAPLSHCEQAEAILEEYAGHVQEVMARVGGAGSSVGFGAGGAVVAGAANGAGVGAGVGAGAGAVVGAGVGAVKMETKEAGASVHSTITRLNSSVLSFTTKRKHVLPLVKP